MDFYSYKMCICSCKPKSILRAFLGLLDPRQRTLLWSWQKKNLGFLENQREQQVQWEPEGLPRVSVGV